MSPPLAPAASLSFDRVPGSVLTPPHPTSSQDDVEALFKFELAFNLWSAELAVVLLTLTLTVYLLVESLAQSRTSTASLVVSILLFPAALVTQILAVAFLLRLRSSARVHRDALLASFMDEAGPPRSVGQGPQLPSPDRRWGHRLLPQPALTWWLMRGWDAHLAACLFLVAIAFNATYLAICEQSGNDEELCTGYSSGRYPLPPALIVLAAAISLPIVTGDVMVGIGANLCGYAVLVVQMCILYSGVQGRRSRVWDTILVALLLAACFLGSVLTTYMLGRERRSTFQFSLSLKRQFHRYRVTVSKWGDAQSGIAKAREATLKANTAQVVSEATIGYAAHQLRNPLHMLSSLVAELEEQSAALGWVEGGGGIVVGSRADGRDTDVRDMRAAIAHMVRVTENAMEHQQLLTTRMPLTLARTNLRNELSSVAEVLARRYHFPVSMSVAEAVPTHVVVDTARLQQVFSNGLANALEATPAVRDGGYVDVLVYVVLAPPVPRKSDGTLQPVAHKQGWPVADYQHVVASLQSAECTPSVQSTASGAAASGATDLPEGCLQSLRPHVHIEVINAGRGLRGASPRALFNPFQTTDLESVSPNRLRMIGLGLSIVRLVAQLLRARVGLFDENSAAPSTAAPAITHFFVELPISVRELVGHRAVPSITSPIVGAPEASPLGGDPSPQPLVGETSPSPPPTSFPVTVAMAASLEETAGEGGAGGVGGLDDGVVHVEEQPGGVHSARRAWGMPPRARPLVSVSPNAGEGYRGQSGLPVGAGLRWRTTLHNPGLPPLSGKGGGHHPVLPPSVAEVAAPLVPAPAPLPYAGLRVLVVDDELSNRKVNERMVGKLGAVVTLAEDGDVALQAVLDAEARGEPFDVVLLDIVMRRMHGDEVCRILRQRGHTGPIVAATGNATRKDKERCLTQGFDAVLAKPFMSQQIRECFDALKVMQRRRGAGAAV